MIARVFSLAGAVGRDSLEPDPAAKHALAEKSKRLWWVILSVSLLLVFHHASSAAQTDPKVPPGYSLVYEQSFEKATALHDFVVTDPLAWRWAVTNATS